MQRRGSGASANSGGPFARVADEAEKAPAELKFFVNLHAVDLNDDDLFTNSPLTKMAGRVILEITERASLEVVKNLDQRIQKLRDLGFMIAIDDLGSGYAGLKIFATLNPGMANLDMSLIRGIDAHPRKQSIVRSMCQLCDQLGILVVAEGVEKAGERDTLTSLGCNLLQGYLFARPERGLTGCNIS